MGFAMTDAPADDETAWTLRLPRALLAALDAEVARRNAARGGRGARWSRNALAVDTLSAAADAWALAATAKDGA
jgi:hypothetical protein